MSKALLHRKRAVALGAVAAALAAVALVPAALLSPAHLAAAAAIGPATGTTAPMTLTQKLDDGYAKGKPGPTASVTVSQTTDLTRQRVTVSWTGLSPTTDTYTKYPVVIMQ